MTNFEKWKESLMIDEASDILGDLATENEECPIECPLYYTKIFRQQYFCIYGESCKRNIAKFFEKNHETLKRWKKDLTVDKAGDILGRAMHLVGKCLPYCPLHGHCSKSSEDYCEDIIHRYFMEEAG